MSVLSNRLMLMYLPTTWHKLRRYWAKERWVNTTMCLPPCFAARYWRIAFGLYCEQQEPAIAIMKPSGEYKTAKRLR